MLSMDRARLYLPCHFRGPTVPAEISRVEGAVTTYTREWGAVKAQGPQLCGAEPAKSSASPQYFHPPPGFWLAVFTLRCCRDKTR